MRGDKSNDAPSFLMEQKITWLFSESGDFEDSRMHEKAFSERVAAEYFLRILGFGGAPTSGSWQWDSHEHCLLILYKAKTKNFFKRFHHTSFNYKLRQAGHSYPQISKCLLGLCPNPRELWWNITGCALQRVRRWTELPAEPKRVSAGLVFFYIERL